MPDNIIRLQDFDPDRPIESYPEGTLFRLIDDSSLEEELKELEAACGGQEKQVEE